MKDLKVGRFVMIDGIACRVVDIEVSAPGKHGAAKMRITGIGIFDGQKKTLLKPSSGDIEVPVITKKKAQVVSVSDTTAQVMDLESYETFDLPIPEDMKGSVKAGAEIEIMEASGRRAISRVMGG
jgi:translation initiation factor 5A